MRFSIPRFLRAPAQEAVSSPPPAVHADTALVPPEPQVTPRFKTPRALPAAIATVLPMVPAIITDPAQRILAARLALQEARFANISSGTTPEGMMRTFFEQLQEHVAMQDSMGEQPPRDTF